jgi:hypothetical protein
MYTGNLLAVLQGLACRTACLDELPFLERWRTVWYGLKQPVDSGEYKFARLQILRLSAVAAAVLTPCLAVLLLIMLSIMGFSPPTYPDVVANLPREVEKSPPDFDPAPKPVDPLDDPIDKATDAPPEAMGLGLTRTVTDFGAPVQPNVSPVVVAGIVQSRIPVPTVPPDVPIGDRPGLGLKRGVPRGVPDGKGPAQPGEDAIFRALRWLKANQASDGSWPNVRPAMTSLALLAFLGHGELPDSEEFGGTVQRAMEWLVSNQEPDGRFKGRDPNDYSQPIAAYALCEAVMLTRVPSVRYAAERAVEVLLTGQHPDGAWDYRCRQSERKDTSYMGWCIQALKAASLAKVGDQRRTEEASIRAAAAMRRQFCAGSDANYGGVFSYTGPGTGQGGLTGVGVLCLQLLRVADTAEARGGMRTVEQWNVNWANPGVTSPLYYWYYGVQAAFHNGGSAWEKWNPMLARELVRNQVRVPGGEGGRELGYWDSPSASEHHDGRVMDTCLCVLMLEVPYRYLPLYRKLPDTPAATAVPASSVRDVRVDVNGI